MYLPALICISYSMMLSFGIPMLKRPAPKGRNDYRALQRLGAAINNLSVFSSRLCAGVHALPTDITQSDILMHFGAIPKKREPAQHTLTRSGAMTT